ncbi:alpha-L-rhamnosidase-related protein [Robiginitalea marina]|uniref:Glycogen debranching protein n=1 Tax=Robiginitalea marina TaxID=2954105 RepID=A0ABT1AWX8_9FLAO|nr:glycogen debranching protein [Robiginitalea marina]MCO5724506.1 glycogen debranching protein [Robiginitalea marina]
MKFPTLYPFALGILLMFSCQERPPASDRPLGSLLKGEPSIEGKKEYLQSPFLTAGDRVYMVGYQDGSFPDLGWHIKGEMGGIWDHPIKLMDGFTAFLTLDGVTHPLEGAHRFVNYPMAGRHDYSRGLPGLEAERWQFVPDAKEGVVVEYVLRNTSQKEMPLEFGFVGHTDLRPTWLGERTGMADGKDLPAFDEALGAWVVKDSLNPWFVVFGSDLPADSRESPAPLDTPGKAGNETSSVLSYAVTLPPGGQKTIRFAIAGSYSDEAQAKATFSDLLKNASADLIAKRERYAGLASRSRLTTPDSALNETFEWLKYNCDWLIRDVPEIGRGIGAGIPDYPWWFGVDSEYALQGYMALGQREIVYETIRLLDSVSEAVNGNGRILHEMSTNGAVFNPGNINETPQFASLVWQVYKWDGNRDFLKRYFPTVKKGLQWLMDENDRDGNGFPDGFGMMEIHGLDSEMIDVASYTQAAFSHAALMAEELGETSLARAYAQQADTLKARINREFWSAPFRSYADFIGTDQQALGLIEDAIVRADTLGKPWAARELEQTRNQILQNPHPRPRPFVVHHNWVVNTPMEMGIADRDKALEALETARNFTNPFGMFVTGIDRDETAGDDKGSFKGSSVFSYTGAVMTLPTGVQAIAENNYGRPDQALDYLNRMVRSFSYAFPGSMYEVSPDYGMIAQAWNSYSFAVPIIRQFFGIDPMASRKQVRLRPQMPASWEKASLEDVHIGENRVSVFYEKDPEGSIRLRVVQTREDWNLLLHLEGVLEGSLELLEGEALQRWENGTLEVSGKGQAIELRYIKN